MDIVDGGTLVLKKQWNIEAQKKVIKTPVEHNCTHEPNQVKNFKELF